uniref:Uncharacterized protein n=1 Tax=Daphnia galeata TaxID=27404 RepID=A0A8J2RRE6_9CRUS|nr:unnamed protein product [Daphnia galeata]
MSSNALWMTLVPMVNDGRPVPVVSSLPSAATVSIGNDVDRQHSSLLSPPLPVLTLFIGMLIEDDMMTTLPSIHSHTIRTVNQKPSSLKWTQQKTTNRRISCSGNETMIEETAVVVSRLLSVLNTQFVDVDDEQDEEPILSFLVDSRPFPSPFWIENFCISRGTSRRMKNGSQAIQILTTGPRVENCKTRPTFPDEITNMN